VVTRATRATTEATVLDSQKLQTIAQLSSGLAHLISNVLTVLRSVVEQLAGANTPSEVHDIVRGVLEVVEQAALTTTDLLVFSRKDAFATVPIALRGHLTALEPMLKRTLPANVSVVQQIDPLRTILAEPVRLTQLILNLVLNARDALPAGGTIHISATMLPILPTDTFQLGLAPGEYLEVLVADDGEGMRPDVLIRACEPFFTTREPSRHAGMGLFVAHGLAKQWGGYTATPLIGGHRCACFCTTSNGAVRN
jgi:two-component system CheB/CheR fusion protein